MKSKILTQVLMDKIEQELLRLLPATDHQIIRVREYYLKILEWVVEQVESSMCTHGPLIVGVNGPQGSGKSTLTAALVSVLPQAGLRAITISIDDFYWTHKEQLALAEAHPQNPLLQQRGYPGTHDIQLGLDKLKVLRNIVSSGMVEQVSSLPFLSPISMPRYDKSKYEGQGDRLPESEWTQINGPLDIVFFEGWMLGFTQANESMIPTSPGFLEINEALGAYRAWYDELDAFIHLIPEDIQYVVDWRVEAEERMLSQGKSGMSREEITLYIKKFILAYQVYLPKLIDYPLLPGKTLQVVLSKERLQSIKLDH